jgi:hypothetical protein
MKNIPFPDDEVRKDPGDWNYAQSLKLLIRQNSTREDNSAVLEHRMERCAAK